MRRMGSLWGRRALGSAVAMVLLVVAGHAVPITAQTTEIRIVRGPGPVAWLGIRFDIIQGRNGPQILTEVPVGSPAFKAGISAGDTLVRVDGSTRVLDRLEDLRSELRPGSAVRFTVRNADGERDVVVRAEPSPDDRALPSEIVWVDSVMWALQGQMDSMLALVAERADGTRDRIRLVEIAPAGRGRRTMVRVEAQPDAMRSTVSGRIPGAVAPNRVMSLDSTGVLLPRPFMLTLDSFGLRLAPEAFTGVGGAVQARVAPEARIILGAPGRFLGGARVETLNPDLASYFGERSGVLVVDVRDGTPASAVGLRGGDIVVLVDGIRVASTADLDRAVRDPEARTLAIVRAGVSMRVPIPR